MNNQLLSEAKAGDPCQRRNGKWVQLDNDDALLKNASNNLYRACAYLYDGRTIYVGLDGECINNQTDFDIIATEPLAPEGTAEWAWQMNKQLGMKIWHEKSGYIEDGDITMGSKKLFIHAAYHDGWQLYEETT